MEKIERFQAELASVSVATRASSVGRSANAEVGVSGSALLAADPVEISAVARDLAPELPSPASVVEERRLSVSLDQSMPVQNIRLVYATGSIITPGNGSGVNVLG